MNAPPDIVHDSAGVSDPGYSAKTRPFYWSVKRELWENRSIYIAPLIVAVVVLFGFLVSTSGLPERRRAVLLLDPAKARAAIEIPYNVAAMMLIFTAFIVGVFYCLDALHGERRDRSILFWKSLPVSDEATVASKLFVGLIVVPVGTFVVALVTSLLFAAIWNLRASFGHSPDLVLWDTVALFKVQILMLLGLMVSILWYAPLVACLVLAPGFGATYCCG
jgi:ABC-2 type transport system permease protein